MREDGVLYLNDRLKKNQYLKKKNYDGYKKKKNLKSILSKVFLKKKIFLIRREIRFKTSLAPCKILFSNSLSKKSYFDFTNKCLLSNMSNLMLKFF